MSYEYAADYINAPASPAVMRSKGITTIMRYLSGYASKDLSKSEAAALHAGGLSIGLVWETSATRAGMGYAAGLSDATSANRMADALGYPADCPIFYAVDYPATPAQVDPYFKGAVSLKGRPVGIYGSEQVCSWILAWGHATYAWQTMAWSFGKVSSVACMLQLNYRTLPLGGSWDENRVLIPFPRWTGGGTTPTGGFLMALTDAQQAEIYDFLIKRHPQPGAWALSSADGATIVKAITASKTDPAALAAALLPGLVSALSGATTLTQTDVEAAIRKVFAELATPPAA